VIKARRNQEHVANMEEMRNPYHLKGRNHLKELDSDGRVILQWENVVWILMLQNRDQWQSLVNTAMNIWVE
jgi:hypothetical protein